MTNMLKKTFVTTVAATLLAGTSFAFAQEKPTNMDGTPATSVETEKLDSGMTGSVDQGMMMGDQDVAAWTDGKYNVVVLGTLNDTDPLTTQFKDYKTSNADKVASLQAAIQGNAALTAKLQAENVQINNIVAAQKAADGSVTFYVQ